MLSWNFGKGWFASAGFTFMAPDGSTYNGTLNPDYWTWEPRVAIAYLDNDWHFTANFKYDVNGASAGHTGTYAATAIPILTQIGNGYLGGA